MLGEAKVAKAGWVEQKRNYPLFLQMARSKRQIQIRLLQWFGNNGRDLPWRKTRDPYAIWVSEIMLQQTQVKTVIPYYQKFLTSFPTVRHLGRANLNDVLKVWEGLGYYSRARNLHRASQIVSKDFQGKIPDALKDLLALPGIGRYTAGAILSIAFNKEESILDGNVKRVLSRLFAIASDPKDSQTQHRLWDISSSLIPKGRASGFNQALMDLGALICVPQKPLCSRCPLQNLCQARATGSPERFPFKPIKKKIPNVEAVSAVVVHKGRVLLRQRPPGDLLGGLWQFPNWPSKRRKDLERYLKKKVKDEMGITVKCKRPLGLFKQTFSHFKLTLHVYWCHPSSGKGNGGWVPIPDLHLFPMSRIDRKIADSIGSKWMIL